MGKNLNQLSAKTKLVLARITLLFSLIFLSGCDQNPEAPPIRVSASYWIGYEPLFVAEGLGLFPEGSVHVVENINAVTLGQTLRGDTIDAIMLSLSRAMDYAAENENVTLVLILGWSNGADKLLVKPEIEKISDLRNKRIGTELDTVNTYLLLRALQSGNMTLNDATVVALANEGMEQLVASERLDAASVYGRAAIAMEAEGMKPIFDSSQIPGEIMDVLLVRTPFLKAYPERVADLIEGWVSAVEYLKNPPDDFVPYLVEDADYRENAPLVHFATAKDNEKFVEDDWAALRDIVKKRQDANALLSGTTSPNLLPSLDSKPFLSIWPDQP